MSVALTLVFLGVSLGGERCFASETCAAVFRFFDMNSESAIPTWFLAALWLLASAMAAVVASQTQAAKRWGVGYWWALSALCVLLSANEVASILDFLARLLADAIAGESGNQNPFRILVILAALVLGAVFVPLLTHLSADVRRILLAWGGLLLFSKIVVGGGGLFLAGEAGLVLDRAGVDYLVAAREFGAMLSAVVLVNGLMLQASYGRFDLRLTFRP